MSEEELCLIFHDKRTSDLLHETEVISMVPDLNYFAVFKSEYVYSSELDPFSRRSNPATFPRAFLLSPIWQQTIFSSEMMKLISKLIVGEGVSESLRRFLLPFGTCSRTFWVSRVVADIFDCEDFVSYIEVSFVPDFIIVPARECRVSGLCHGYFLLSHFLWSIYLET